MSHHGKPFENVVLVRFVIKIERCLPLKSPDEFPFLDDSPVPSDAIQLESLFELRLEILAKPFGSEHPSGIESALGPTKQLLHLLDIGPSRYAP